VLKRKTFLGICVGFLAFALVGMASAQPGGGRGQGERPGRGGRGGGFDPAQFRQMMADRMKEQLKVGDDEWKIIEPRLTKVTTLQREAASGGRGVFGGFSGFGGFGGRGGSGRGGPGRDPGQRGQRGQRGGGDQARELNATQAAMQALREILEKDDATPDQIKTKLTALRAAKESARQKLAAARKGLREVCTLKQEAQLCIFGLLE